MRIPESDDELLAQCEVETYRSRGPGGAEREHPEHRDSSSAPPIGPRRNQPTRTEPAPEQAARGTRTPSPTRGAVSRTAGAYPHASAALRKSTYTQSETEEKSAQDPPPQAASRRVESSQIRYLHVMRQQDAFDVAVVGAGPAGLTAAYRAAKAGARTLLLDRNAQPSRKIALSGGGRCNILPQVVDSSVYVTDSSKNTLRKLLLSWPLAEVTAHLEENVGLSLRTPDPAGKLFPAEDGETVRRRLLSCACTAGATLRTNALVTQIDPGAPLSVRIRDDERVQAHRLILATGGQSYPSTGSDGLGWKLAKQLGHTVVAPYPALVSLRGGPKPHHDLAGLSVEVELTVSDETDRVRTRGSLLFTHQGYSGPVILNAAHRAARAKQQHRSLAMTVSWGAQTEDAWIGCLSGPGPFGIRRVIRDILPDRLVVCLLDELGLTGAKYSELRKATRRALIDALTAYEISWSDTDGFGQAEVTGGGIPLAEVVPKTLESRVVPGLYFCGETLDAFGPIGGTNFLWAFVTGKVAGDGAARHAESLSRRT